MSSTFFRFCEVFNFNISIIDFTKCKGYNLEKGLRSINMRLRELRKSKNMTLKDIANILNVSESAISQYENNKREMDNASLAIIADYFHVTIDYLLGRTDSPNLAIPKEMEGIGVAFSSGISMDGLNADQIEDIMNYIDYIKSKKKN